MVGTWRRLIAFAVLAIWLASCTAPATPTALPPTITPLDIVDQAAAQATAIVQQARATALVLQAQVQATHLIEQANGAGAPIDAPTAGIEALAPEEQVTSTNLEASVAATPMVETVMAGTPTAANTVEMLGVGFAAEGGFIIVNFKAPPSVVQNWWQGRVSVTDETSGTVFNEIPVMPVIGPLIGRPVEAGQNGYVMLTHNPPILRIGSLVTVMLGDYKFEHVKIQ